MPEHENITKLMMIKNYFFSQLLSIKSFLTVSFPYIENIPELKTLEW